MQRDQEKAIEQGMPIEQGFSAEQPEAKPIEQNTADHSPAAESYRKGSESLEKGETDAAIKLLSRAIELDSKYAPAYCDRGLAFATKGELDKAVADLSTAIQLAPTGGRSYFNRGFAYFQKGDYDKAIADYSEAIRLHPSYAEAYRDRGYVRTLKGDWEQALVDLDFAVRLNPKDPSAYVSRGKTYSEMGDWPSAIADYDEAIKLDAKDAGAWCDRGNARAMNGDFDKALADVEQALKLAPDEPAYRFTRGFAYLKKGDLDKALADFNEVLHADPKFGEAYRERGHCLIIKGEFDKALVDLNEAIKLVPEDDAALFYRGYACALKGDFDKALADYDQAIKLDATFAEAYFNRALARGAKDDWDKALADYKEVIGLDPRTAEAYKDWGRAEDKERRAKTVEQLEQTLAKAQPEAQRHFQQGVALHKEGTLDKALAEYDQALALYPRYTEVYYNRGLAYRQKDELAKAIADYSRAIRLNPKYVPAYANRGYVYYKQGRTEKALADFEKILELDPTNADAKKSRDIILSQKETSEAKMSISKESLGKTAEGAEVDQYTLGNGNGLRVKIMTYGATITSVEVPDRNGKSENVTLHLDSLADYLKGHPFFGSTVGRYANRIAKGKFTLDGKQYTLATNNGPNHLHGGIKGFDKVVWKAEPVESDASVGVVFSYESADGEEGYPGALSVRVTYSLTNDDELKMAYWAKTDKPTVLNLTNHTYWNLGDGGASDVLGYELTLNADRYLPVDAGLIPLGELKNVKGTPMDFLRPNTIGARIKQVEGGYDHCYVLNKEPGEKGLSLAARVVAPKSGRVMEVYTTQPAIQFYSANFLDGTLHADGKTYGPHFAFCLETQHYPDSPNQPTFPTTVLKPGEEYEQLTVHKFSVK
jgi:aldose 1-epimerase